MHKACSSPAGKEWYKKIVPSSTLWTAIKADKTKEFFLLTANKILTEKARNLTFQSENKWKKRLRNNSDNLRNRTMSNNPNFWRPKVIRKPKIPIRTFYFTMKLISSKNLPISTTSNSLKPILSVKSRKRSTLIKKSGLKKITNLFKL
jgi:hypothetical protein